MKIFYIIYWSEREIHKKEVPVIDPKDSYMQSMNSTTEPHSLTIGFNWYNSTYLMIHSRQ